MFMRTTMTLLSQSYKQQCQALTHGNSQVAAMAATTTTKRMPMNHHKKVQPPKAMTTKKQDTTLLCHCQHSFMSVLQDCGLLIPAIFASRICNLPLVMSYHTHLPAYLWIYFRKPWNSLLEWLEWLEWPVWFSLGITHSFANVTLVPSSQMQDELHRQHHIANVELWPKGINTTRFHPDYKSTEMHQCMMTGGAGRHDPPEDGDNDDDKLLLF
jgi:glycosyltransferase involved in cell wall biosynthesis